MSSRPSRGAARLASILDALPDALLLVNANGTVVNANAIALETFETRGTALVGRGLLDLLPDFDPKRIPGSMRSPREAAEDTRTKPTRMTAHRTDGSAFPAQVTSANLEDGRTPYADFGDGVPHYTGDELLMLVVRDLSGTVDTEAELARQQRQTEMILRAAAEGVVGVDTAGKVVLVNPSAAQILGHRATDLGGRELHPLVHHSRADGSPLAYEETPLADTLRSGRKHRVRGQVLWRKDGKPVPVDLTTAPVRDGDQLVGAVMTFTDRTQYDAMEARVGQLRALLDTSLRGPLAELRGELTGLAADPAGQLWPEANQILHHLAAGYARITTLIDNVLAFQRLDRGEDRLHRAPVGLDDLVAAAVEGAVELIGPGRAQYAVHAPPAEVSVDGERMATALSHLIADVAGVDSAGNAIAYSGDSTIVVAAAQRGDVVRIDVRGPSAGGDPVHLPLARGVVEAHGGVLQTHEVPGQGSAYVLEVPAAGTGSDGSGAGAASAAGGRTGTGSRGRAATAGTGTGGARSGDGGADAAHGPAAGTDAGTDAHAGTDAGSGTGAGGAPPGDGRPRPRTSADPVDPSHDTGTIVAPWAVPAAADQSEAPTGRRRALRRPSDEHGAAAGAPAGEPSGAPEGAGPDQPTGRRARRARPEEDEGAQAGQAGQPVRAELPAPPIPNALPAAGADSGRPQGPPEGTGRRARRAIEPPAAPGAAPNAPVAVPPQGNAPQPSWPASPVGGPPTPQEWPGPHAQNPGHPAAQNPSAQNPSAQNPPAQPPSTPEPGSRPVPPRPGTPEPAQWPGPQPQPQPEEGAQPRFRRPGTSASGDWPEQHGSAGATGDAGTTGDTGGDDGAAEPAAAPWPDPQGQGPHGQDSGPGGGQPAPRRPEAPGPTQWPEPHGAGGDPAAGDPRHQNAWPAAPGAPAGGPPPLASAPPALGMGEHDDRQQHSHGRAISVRTLGQGVPFAGDARTGGQPELPAQVAAGGSGRRRRLAAPPQQSSGSILPRVPSQPAPTPGGETQARQHPQADPDSGQLPVRRPGQGDGAGSSTSTGTDTGTDAGTGTGTGTGTAPARPDDRETALLRPVPSGDAEQGRSYAIGAPAEGADEGPELLDGPNGAVDVTDAVDAADDRHEEPLEEPRRLLVWPEPDVSTRQALTDRGYRPVIVRSREEVDAQVAEPPAALFVDPLTGPITRTALQSLRQAAAAADVPVLVTAGLGQATREAAYGADPAVLLKALAPRDSEQHPPRVLLVESHDPIAQAFAATLERRGMQVTHANSETDAMTQAAQIHPNLVVMDLMLIRRRRQGIVDWLRGHARLNTTPLVVYTSADIDPAELPRLASGETVLFLAERSTSTDVQARIVDLLGKIGA
ncbi:PAS domain-containing protein [Streptomyces sp. V4-01]|uniref:PAS domain-containing protein n=1 Tax=Actinacidiphila polyblastidii TaxID=3110430 RepID=A0ABU7P7V8_9ACTN|nr:PAS domain-containing protein [Streptomyces sp. V4-01]